VPSVEGRAMRYGMAIKGTADVPPNAEILDRVVDDLMEALLDLGVDDPAVSGTLSNMAVEIEMVVDAESPAEAVAKAADVLRDAMVKMFGQQPPGGIAEAFPEWTARREDALTPA
jgi:hypothetical protein